MVSPFDSAKGFPVSSVITFAISSTLSLIKSAVFFIIFDRSQGEVFFQFSIAFFADCKASSNSFSFEDGIVPITSSLKGLNTSTFSFVLLDH